MSVLGSKGVMADRAGVIIKVAMDILLGVVTMVVDILSFVSLLLLLEVELVLVLGNMSIDSLSLSSSFVSEAVSTRTKPFLCNEAGVASSIRKVCISTTSLEMVRGDVVAT